MALPGIAMAGGQGGIDLSGGPSAADSGSTGSAGGQVFQFATPESVQMTQALSWPMVVGVAVVGLWLYKRGK